MKLWMQGFPQDKKRKIPDVGWSSEAREVALEDEEGSQQLMNQGCGRDNAGQVTPKHFSALSSEMSVDLIDPHEAMDARISDVGWSSEAREVALEDEEGSQQLMNQGCGRLWKSLAQPSRPRPLIMLVRLPRSIFQLCLLKCRST
jgi:hypothetical protein